MTSKCSLSDYRQQFIPNQILKTFKPERVEKFKNYSEDEIINWKKYSRYEEIVAFLYQLHRKFTHLVTIIPIGFSYEKRPLLVVKIAESGSSTYDRIFIEGGIHANEWISPASVLFLIKKLATEWDNLPTSMKKKTWLILPLANPDGYVFTHSDKEERMWRKNRKNNNDPDNIGVDLNRNFDIGWDKSKDKNIKNYKGSQPFSEKETKAIRDFLMPQKKYLKAYIAFHTFGQEIRYRWIYSRPLENKARLKEVVDEAIKEMNSTTGSKKIKYSSRDKPIEGLYGLSKDWARKELNINYAFTVELRDKGDKGHLLSPRLIVKTGTDAFSFIKVIAKAISDDIRVENERNCFFSKQELDYLLLRGPYLFKGKRKRKY